MSVEPATKLLAVLVDAENTSARIAEALFKEIATLGEAAVRRVYGDFSSPQMRAWADVLARFAIQPQQNFANTKGKNSGDIALVIDAMDLLHARRFDAFCLVSSDSDFTRLASRIREEGVEVYGFGERKTPESFRQACTRFIYNENLDSALNQKAVPDAAAKTLDAKKSAPLIEQAISALGESDDWMPLSAIGHQLRLANPDFDHRTYGYAKLSELIRALGRYEVHAEAGGIMRVRRKGRDA